MEKEIKSFGFEVKALDDNHFEGYASVFRNVDSYGDVIEPGAFSKTLSENAKRVKVLWQHDWYMPIGKPIQMEEDNHGLYVKAKISQTEEGKRALILMKDGVIDEMSIGFNTIKDEWDKTNNVRRIKELRLWEFSPVTFAANDMAQITGVKNFNFKGLGPYAIAHILDELKAGKVLSDKNKGLVTQAIEALTALLDASEGKGEPPQPGTHLQEDEKKAAEDIYKLMREMREFANMGRV